MRRAAVAWLVLLGMPAAAQEFRATLTGRVTDPSGAAIPNAQITVTQRETNAQTRRVSSATGDYVVPFLVPGEYSLTVEQAGFKRFVRDGIRLQVQDRVAVDVVLQLGELADTVTVVASTAQLETANASIGAVVGQSTIVDMPMNGRNPFRLAQLVPGVTPTGRASNLFLSRYTATGATGVADMTISGGTNAYNEWMLDGVSVTGNDNYVTYIPAVDATQEFKVQSNAFDAEFGRFLGGVVSATIKSGTNESHGAIVAFHRNSALNARDFFAATKPAFQFTQYAASTGGPVWIPKVYNGKDKTFFFFSYEGSREGVARAFVSTVPTALQREGDFSQTQTKLTTGAAAPVIIYDPRSTRRSGSAYVRDPFPGNIIPADRIDRIAKNMLQAVPLPNQTGDPITNSQNYPLAFKDPVSDAGYVTKIDHRFSDRHQVFVRTSWRRFWVDAAGAFKSPVTTAHTRRTMPGFAFDDTLTLNPTTVLNLRYGMARYPTKGTRGAEEYDMVALGFPESLARVIDQPGFPTISISGYTGFGGSQVSNATQETHSAHAGMMKQVGRHSMRFGWDGRLGRNTSGPGGTTAGTYSFSSVFTRGPNPQASTLTGGSALASFLLGLGSSGSIPYTASTAEQTPYNSFYFQNDMRLSPKLTVNLGLRYELEGAHTERFNRLNRGFDLTSASPIESQARANYALSPLPEIAAADFKVKGGLLFAGVGGQPRGLTNLDYNNISPRIGVAYSLNDTTVIRGGYGVFFAPTTALTKSTYGFSTTSTWLVSTDGSLTPADTLSNPFPGGLLAPPAAEGGLMTNIGQSVTYADLDRRNGYAHQFQFSLQRRLPGNVVAEAAYVGLRGSLPVTLPLNALPDQHRAAARTAYLATGRNTLNDTVTNPFQGLINTGVYTSAKIARSYLLRPYPHLTGLSKANVDTGWSQYDSFQLKVTKRLAEGLQFLASYTNSKKLVKDYYLNDTDLELTRVLSDEDIPQRLVISGSYELPFGKGRPFGGGASGVVGKILEGWQLNWIYQAQSGIPLSVASAESVGRSAKLSGDEQNLRRWFDTSAFRLRETLELVGTEVLPDVRSLGRNMMDLSLYKNTTIWERLKVQFRAESFNLFNRTEFDVPNTTLGNASFGVVSAQINFARQLQFGLRLIW